MEGITVIIPVYNVEKYLKRCVESVLEQSIKPVDIVLVDDGSTDSSSKICDEYAQAEASIQVIHKKNEGLGYARNTGLKYALGKYVTFIDSDDYVHPNHLEKLYNNLVNNGSDVCYGGHTKITGEEKTEYVNVFSNQVFKESDIQYKIIPRLCGQTGSYDDGIQMSVCMALYSMKIIIAFNILFKSEREYMSEDLLFNLEYLKHANVVSFSDNIGYMYLYNPSSLSHKYLPNRFRKGKIMKDEVSRITKEMGIYDVCQQRIYNTFIICTRLSLMSEQKFYKQNGFVNSYNDFKAIMNDTELQKILKDYDQSNVRKQAKVINWLIKTRKSCILWCVFSILSVK